MHAQKLNSLHFHFWKLLLAQWKYLSCLFLMSNKHSCVLIPPPTTLQLTSNLKCEKSEQIFKRVFQCSVTDVSGSIQNLQKLSLHWCHSGHGLEAKVLICSLKKLPLAVNQLFLFWANKLTIPCQLLLYFLFLFLLLDTPYLHPCFFALRPECAGPHLR